LLPDCVYLSSMSLPHPDPDQIELANVLSALGDETRLAMIGYLARNEASGGMTCGQFCTLGSKTNISYHVAKLREAGVVNVEPIGTSRLVTLRRCDLDQRFPGLLDSIIATAVRLPLVIEHWDADAQKPQA
jgi:DNA-binding transcriptional ArsR family regulator